MRQALAVVAAAAVTALAALMLGEYQFTGWNPIASGVLFGLAIAEVVLGVARPRPRWLIAVTVVGGVVAMLWAGWISVSNRDEPIPGGAWVAAGLAAGVAALRTWSGTGPRAASSTPGAR